MRDRWATRTKQRNRQSKLNIGKVQMLNATWITISTYYQQVKDFIFVFRMR